MTFESIKNLYPNSNCDTPKAVDGNTTCVAENITFDLWCDYIYLDTDERRKALLKYVARIFDRTITELSENTISSTPPLQLILI